MKTRVRKKLCRDCGHRKPLDEFHRNRKRLDGRQDWCKLCHNARARAWRKRNPGYYDRRLKRDPTYFRGKKLLKLYGISLEQYELMYRVQGGVCRICGKPESRKVNGKPVPLSVDHDHKTGKVRGLLCYACNVALGFLEKTDWVKRAYAYLEQAGTHVRRG